MAKRAASPWLHIVTLFGLPIVGYAAGLGLASWSAPGSGLAAALSGMLLPTAFAAGLIVWAGLEAVLGVFMVLRHGRRAASRHELGGRSGRARSTPEDPVNQPGARESMGYRGRAFGWFVPIAAVLSGAGGLLVGALPGGAGLLASTALYTSAGVAYGWFVAWLAAAGCLPSPGE